MANGCETLQHALALHQAGQLAEAETIYRHLLAANPQQPEPHVYLALVEQARGDLLAACDCCYRALALKPKFAEAQFALGNLLNALGREAEAAASFERAIAADERFFPAHVSLASLLRKRGEFDAAPRI